MNGNLDTCFYGSTLLHPALHSYGVDPFMALIHVSSGHAAGTTESSPPTYCFVLYPNVIIQHVGESVIHRLRFRSAEMSMTFNLWLFLECIVLLHN